MLAIAQRYCERHEAIQFSRLDPGFRLAAMGLTAAGELRDHTPLVFGERAHVQKERRGTKPVRVAKRKRAA
jgi:hypothetical protein